MHLLYISLEFVLPVNNGHRMRMWSVLEALAAEGHEVTFVSLAEEPDLSVDLQPLRQICHRVELVPHTLYRLADSANYLGRLRAFLSFGAYGTRRFVSAAMKSRIGTCLRDENPGALICDTVFAAVNLPATDIPLVINNPDVEHTILQRYVEFERNPIKRLYARLEARKVKQWEAKICRRATVCMACSEKDRQILAALAPETYATLVPNVVDTRSYEPSYETTSRCVLFQGGMDWFPNRDAVKFFVTQIFPLLRQDLPDVEFIAAGRNPSPEMLAEFLQVPGVKFTGTVPDMRPYLEQAAVCAVPLRIGSGTRLKILEAAAAGKAIVSTRLGAEGLDFEDGTEILLADEPQEFAAALKSLLREPARRRAIGEAARRRVREQYSYATLQDSLRRAFALLTRRQLTTEATCGAPRARQDVFVGDAVSRERLREREGALETDVKRPCKG
jgi:glycosyltransferase involved in cell wall biosynthesis